MTLPYTYLIGWTVCDKWYYGVRYGKNCNPNELWKTYYTSSQHVHKFVNEMGSPDIVMVRKVFNNATDARTWEHKVLKRLHVIRNNKWLNKTDNIAFDPLLMSEIGKTKTGILNNFYGFTHSEETKQKISISKKQKMTPEIREKIRIARANQIMKPVSDETRLKISKANKGQVPWSKGRAMSEDTKQRISISESNTKQIIRQKRLKQNDASNI